MDGGECVRQKGTHIDGYMHWVSITRWLSDEEVEVDTGSLVAPTPWRRHDLPAAEEVRKVVYKEMPPHVGDLIILDGSCPFRKRHSLVGLQCSWSWRGMVVDDFHSTAN